MEFDKNGNLYPYSIIETDLETFKKIFVSYFPFSSTRKRLFENYLIYLGNLKETVNTGFYQWIDGSFVTNKEDPKDIDFVTFLDFGLYREHEKAISKLLSLRYDTKNGTDGYFVETFPDTHKGYNNFQMDRIEWLHTFGTSRINQNKGIIQINF